MSKTTGPITIEEAIERSSSQLPSIDLTRVDIGLLAALFIYRDANTDNEIDEVALGDLYWKVCDMLGYSFDQKSLQAVIKRFRAMHLLSCIEGREMAFGTDVSYGLTPLGQAIAQCAIGTEEISALSLEIILGKISGEIISISEKVKAGLRPEEWSKQVSEPFKVHINELFSVISARQGRMDQNTEEVRDKVSKRLSESWFDAIDECIAMLDTITDNLKEINSIYTKYSYQVTEALWEIADKALDANQEICKAQARQILNNFERLTNWSDKKLSGWTRYHKAVNGFITDLVRTDPQRQRSKQMIKVIQATANNPFTFHYAIAPKTHVLREGLKEEKRATVQRHITKDSTVTESERMQLVGFIDRAIEKSTINGMINLVTVGKVLTEDLPSEKLWKALGLIPGRMLRLGHATQSHQKGWHAIDEFNVENLEVRVGGKK